MSHPGDALGALVAAALVFLVEWPYLYRRIRSWQRYPDVVRSPWPSVLYTVVMSFVAFTVVYELALHWS